MDPKPGLCASATLVVADADTAVALGTGEVPVLATPRLVALCEEATVAALASELSPEQTSVCSRVELGHVRPVGLGREVRATVTLERSEGRRLVFAVNVSDDRGLVAAGRVTRVVVERVPFLEKAQ